MISWLLKLVFLRLLGARAASVLMLLGLIQAWRGSRNRPPAPLGARRRTVSAWDATS
jgi:hypothetical protein